MVPVAVLVACMSVLDISIGALCPAEDAGEAMIFPRHKIVRTKTPEFDFTVKTSSLGIRDYEVAWNKRPRIVAIGDSFTYEWGVELEESWPKVLEKQLKAAGCEQP